MKTFCGSYFYKDKWWAFTIEAEDWDDAADRLEQMWTGIIVGELISTEPFHPEALH
jgi:hypothetical protein